MLLGIIGGGKSQLAIEDVTRHRVDDAVAWRIPAEWLAHVAKAWWGWPCD